MVGKSRLQEWEGADCFVSAARKLRQQREMGEYQGKSREDAKSYSSVSSPWDS